MSRKDFVLIASVIRNLDLGNNDQLTDENLRLNIAQDFAEALGQTNPLFNSQRFIEAATKQECCGHSCGCKH